MIKHHALETTWHVKDHGSELLALVTRRDPGVAQLVDELPRSCPVAESCQPFDDGTFHRLKGHVRSFAARTSGGGVVVYKGTEPLTRDYVEVCEDARRARAFCMLSKIDWFLLIENEPFLGQSLPIALHYAKLSLEFTAKYVARTGQLPRMPFPLAVLRLPQQVAEQFAENCRPFISDRPQLSARERLADLIPKGLGVFVYYYPGTPLRAAHARGMFPGSHEAGAFQSAAAIDFKSAIDGWLDLVAEMLVLGYFPTANIHQGNCMQAQNLVIDGGMCDIDSLEAMSNLTTDRDFHDALFYSLLQLTASICSVLTDKTAHVGQIVFATVWSELVTRVQSKSERGLADRRILDALRPMSLEYLFHPRMMDALREMRTNPVGMI